MKYDFFIHCDGLTEEERKSSEGREFLDEILKKARESECHISISGGSILKPFISKERTIYTISHFLEETGKISKEEAEKMKTIVKGFRKEDFFRIHGAYFGKCTAEFASQLFGLVYKNKFWPDFPTSITGNHKPELLIQDAEFAECLRKQEVLKSNIKYGVVFDNKRHPLNSNGVEEFSKQLSDLETRIF